MTLDTGLAVVLGVAVGALAGIVGGALAAWRQSKLALEKWSRSREDQHRRDTREAVATVARTLASTAHSMMWATFKVLTSGKASREALASFEVEFHGEVATLVGAQMQLAALDHALYARVTPYIGQVIALGGNTYAALRASMEKDLDAEDRLRGCNQEALDLIRDVPTKVAGLLAPPEAAAAG
ncbi:hypothetical protein [Variovorax ginsengisoli]|uniref:DUF2489 domain-containing protein n=1 Tax=Variovorax ginsengisoli TaxID=363844 RepID=A0ABT8SA25_9BURK|nr:hypothetical protein [Variovorax ginsengisoli]MDN8616597.1 hypothetical protein [Variovorax ginsengisoli]MDO1535767.1 hypothetical protein [Variovorax ginsengisoli]